MFTKLLKHEWRATRGMLGTLCLVCLGACLLGGGTMRYLMIASSQDAQQNVIVVLNVLAMVAAMIAVAVVGVAALFLYIGRFYKSRFTDEGYLTFTLPVNGHQILMTTVITGVVEMVAISLAVAVSILLMGFVGISGLEGFWEEFPAGVARFFEMLREAIDVSVVGYVLLGILVALSGLVGECCVIMLSVSLGALVAKKHKILLALLFYYLIHMAISVLSVGGLASLSFGVAMESMSYSMVLLMTALGWLAIGTACYFPTHYLITRRLNLP